MKMIALVGTSVLGKLPFSEKLIEALVLEGHSVSVVKHAPDGFDIDTPGKASYARREAGAREVMLVGDRRLVLMREYADAAEPGLEALVAALQPVDLVILEGFHEAAVPTIEVLRPSRKRAPRFHDSRHVVALVSDEPVVARLPVFGLDDIGALAGFVVACTGLTRAGARPAEAGARRLRY